MVERQRFDDVRLCNFESLGDGGGDIGARVLRQWGQRRRLNGRARIQTHAGVFRCIAVASLACARSHA